MISSLALALALVVSPPGGVEAARGAAVVDTVFQLPGRQLNEWFGVYVRGAGDVNRDGYDDLVVGAYANDGGGFDGGRADLYYGGPEPDATPDLTVYGRAWDYLGTAVGGGDVNGDGYSDVLVASPADDGSFMNAGAVFVYFGSASIDTVPDVVLRGEGSENYFGQSAAVVEDQNGDGDRDIVVGAWKNSAAGTEAGRAYLYYGGPGADSLPDRVYTGERTSDNFGFFVADAGDINGDGDSDLIVGAPFHDGVGYHSGRAYVYFGGAGGDSIADLVLDGDVQFANFGFSVGSAGDLDSDGYGDVVVGAVFAGPVNAGRAYVFRGGSSPDAIADMTLEGVNSTDQFGFAVGSPGDWNRDGFDDLIVSAFHHDGNGRDAGRVSLWFGGAVLDSTADVVVDGRMLLDAFGFSAGPAGDLDGNGWPEFVVGAPLAEALGVRQGSVFVFGSDQPTPTTLATFVAEPLDGAIEVRWALSADAPLRDAVLERAEQRSGPWLAVAAETRGENGVTVVIDRTVIAGRRYWYRVVARDLDGALWESPAIEVEAGAAVARFALAPPRPNPADGRFAIALDVPHPSAVTVSMIDVHGRRVATLADGPRARGRHVITWERGASSLAPGLYWVVLESSGIRVARRVVVAQ